MITFDQMPATIPDEHVDLCSDQRVQYAECRAAENSSSETEIPMELNQKVFRIEDGVFLRLKAPLKLTTSGRNIEVKGWSLKVPAMNIDQLDLELVRHFLRLQSKAERDALQEKEHSAWVNIIDSIDYQRLCAERSPQAYCEGTIQTIQENGSIYVEWQDGETEWLSGKVASSISFLKQGDVFGAHIRRDYKDSTTRIEGVTIIGEADTPYTVLPEEWPPVLQVAEENER